MRRLFRRKDIRHMQAEALNSQHLRRALGPGNLVMLGIGAIIGTGIFVLTGTVAAVHAGPAVVLSFVLAGLAAVFAAFCYSEFASLVPMSGSAYAYGYATLGEFFAWIIGWDLILEYAVGAITVAIGWSGYVVSFLHGIGVPLPPEICAPTGTVVKLADGTQAVAWVNLPAVLIVLVITTLLVIGIKESARFNNFIVIIKLTVIMVFIFGAMWAVSPAHWTPFIPPYESPRHFGWSGVLAGAQIVFFAYIGFDAVSTAAQEARNPQRDMPIGIIGSLLICTLLYIVVSGIATGVVPYRELDVADPIALVADRAGMGFMADLIKIGAIAGLSSVILVMLYGQSRVFWAMSSDGLLPPFVNKVHPRFRTPWLTSIVTGLLVAFFAMILPVKEAGELCSMGTLLAFVIVGVGVVVLRVREPHLPRAFKCPAVWFVGPMAALSAGTLMAFASPTAWKRLIIWLLIGLVIYFSYSRHRSKLAHGQPPNGAVTPPAGGG
ncbi:MAG: amino acid permease [Verrucomicrobiae bacterium]|nr:amino acid permease [Verrucomicrobiae bacterium]